MTLSERIPEMPEEQNLEQLDFSQYHEGPEESFEQKTPEKSPDLPPLAALLAGLSNIDGPALQDWVEKVVPQLVAVLAFTNAKGMSAQEAETFLESKNNKNPEKALPKLTGMHDQSMAVHTLNAALAIWPILKLSRFNDDIFLRVVLAGVTLHDLNKMTGEDLQLQGQDAVAYEAALKTWGEKLGLWNYIGPEYWLDVAFLAQNAEAVRGSNTSLVNYQDHDFVLDESDLTRLKEFVRLADLISSEAKRPESLTSMHGTDKVSAILKRVLNNQFELRYHRTADNRGLLTQVIHNAAMEEAQQLGWKPFLFFPDGITYLAPTNSPHPDPSALPEKIRQMLIHTVSDKLDQLVTRGPTGMKFKDDFIALLDVQNAIQIATRRIFSIIKEGKESVTEIRKDKTTVRSGTQRALDFTYQGSLNADRLSEGFFGISKLLEEYYGGNREQHAERLISALGLHDLLEDFRAIDFTGGVGYPWYYIAGHYLKRNPGLSAEDLETRMNQASLEVVAALGDPEREPPFGFLDAYVEAALHWGHQHSPTHFAAELQRYGNNKKPRSGERMCAICNSAIQVRADYSTFSNKQVAGYTDAKRGICAMCQAEDLLRQFTLGREIRNEGDVVFLHLYPTYYFTPLTAQLFRDAYSRFQNVTFVDVIKPYQAANHQPEGLLEKDIFQVSGAPNPKRRLEKVAYSSNQLHGYYLLGVPYLGRDPSDTESWVMPPLLGMLATVLFGVKVVVSPSALPPFNSGADFKETLIVDLPHHFWTHAMRKIHFRLDELKISLKALLAIYGLTSEAFQDSSGFTIWNQLGGVARTLDSDPMLIFGYADRIMAQKKSPVGTEGMQPFMAEKLFRYHQDITSYYSKYSPGGPDTMSMIEHIVEAYAAFYRADGFAAYARLRPFNIAVDVILDAPPELEKADLKLQIEGKLYALLDGMHDALAQGRFPKGYKNENRIALVEHFANIMLDELLEGYCKGERALLRKRLNALRNGCEAYYVKQFGKKPEEI